MIVKFVIPVMDTEKGNYDFDGNISTDQYLQLLNNKVQSNERVMKEFEYNYTHGGSLNLGYSNIYDAQNVNTKKEIDFNFSPSQALIKDGNGNEVNIEFLQGYVESGKKFLLKVNINPNSLEEDAESELRTWLDDSKRVLSDSSLDNKTMLVSLPLRDFIVDTETEDVNGSNKPIYQLLGCKVLQIYPKETSGYDYYFAIMVEKIQIQK
jgi:hypothetical protein